MDEDNTVRHESILCIVHYLFSSQFLLNYCCHRHHICKEIVLQFVFKRHMLLPRRLHHHCHYNISDPVSTNLTPFPIILSLWMICPFLSFDILYFLGAYFRTPFFFFSFESLLSFFIWFYILVITSLTVHHHTITHHIFECESVMFQIIVYEIVHPIFRNKCFTFCFGFSILRLKGQ